MKRFVVVLAVLLCCSQLLYAESKDIPTVKTKVKSIAAFKNGLGFVTRTGTAQLKDGCALLNEVPQAMLGTLWIGSMDASRLIDEVIAYKGADESEVFCKDIIDMLAANVGREAVITYTVSSDKSGTYAGKILELPQETANNPAIPPDPYSSSYSRSYIPPTPQSRLIVIQSADKKILALNTDSIKSVEFPNGDAVFKKKSGKESNFAKIRIANKSLYNSKYEEHADIAVSYLEKGITWSPSYLINIKDEKTAEITLESVFANDVEDVDDADISFVVGYPNFVYADIQSLLSLNQTVAAFMQKLLNYQGNDSSRSRYNLGYGNVAYQVASSRYTNDTSEAYEPTYDAANAMSGESNEDLYFYKKEHVTLKKGDRARYVMFSDKVPYEHVYRWEVPDVMNIDDTGHIQNYDSQRQNYIKNPQVWHTLKLTNQTKNPWTSAPALVVNGTMPVAQDMLKYASVGAKTILNLTVASDVSGSQTQTEIIRTPTPNVSYRDDVCIDGKLAIKNWKTKPIKVSIIKSLTGEVSDVSDSGKITKRAENINSLNPKSTIEWEFDLKPGEEKQFTYNYKVIVNR